MHITVKSYLHTFIYIYDATDNRDHLLVLDAYVSIHWLSKILYKSQLILSFIVIHPDELMDTK
jgi:hypothetical protein